MVVILINFLLSFINLNCYMMKKERYPRYYTCLEKIYFQENGFNLLNAKKWELKTNIKTVNIDFYFGGTPKERLYIKQTMEKINLLLKECKNRNLLIYLNSDLNIHQHEYYYIVNNRVTPKIKFSKKENLNIFISPNIKCWYNENLGYTVLTKIDTRKIKSNYTNCNTFGVTNGNIKVYSNLYYSENMNFIVPNQDNCEKYRINVFKQMILFHLGFENSNDNKSIMSKTILLDEYPILGFREIDLIYIEMKYMNYFMPLEPKETFLKKLWSKENKMKRLDRRSRQEKLKHIA